MSLTRYAASIADITMLPPANYYSTAGYHPPIRPSVFHILSRSLARSAARINSTDGGGTATIQSSYRRLQRTTHAARAHPQDMRVDHRRRYIAMTQQLLHRSYVRSALQEVRGEGMPEGVASDALGNA